MQPRLIIAVVIALLLGLLALALVEAPSWFWHPLGVCTGTPTIVRDCKGYNSWSGSFSDIGELTLITGGILAFLTFWRRHNCHVHTCWRFSWHPHPEHGHPVCKVHHPDGTPGWFAQLFHGATVHHDHLLHPSHHEPAQVPALGTEEGA